MAIVQFVQVEGQAQAEPRGTCAYCACSIPLTDRSGYRIPNGDAYAKLGSMIFLLPHDYPKSSVYQGSRCPGSGTKLK